MNIYESISDIMSEMGGTPKTGKNEYEGYTYRSIDDVYTALQPLLGKHGVVIVPKVLSRESLTANTLTGKPSQRCIMEVEFKVVNRYGSSLKITTWGEALDTSDKATNKALTAAYKYAMIELFCIAVGQEDADASSIEAEPMRSAPRTVKKLPPAKLPPAEASELSTLFAQVPAAGRTELRTELEAQLGYPIRKASEIKEEDVAKAREIIEAKIAS